jgi:hypothetical protein
MPTPVAAAPLTPVAAALATPVPPTQVPPTPLVHARARGGVGPRLGMPGTGGVVIPLPVPPVGRRSATSPHPHRRSLAPT